MRLTWSVSGATWQLTIRLEGEESVVGIGQGGREVGLISDECRVEFPLDLGDVSPDLRALAAVTVASPWLPRQVSFDVPVSPGEKSRPARIRIPIVLKYRSSTALYATVDGI